MLPSTLPCLSLKTECRAKTETTLYLNRITLGHILTCFLTCLDLVDIPCACTKAEGLLRTMSVEAELKARAYVQTCMPLALLKCEASLHGDLTRQRLQRCKDP